MKRIITLLLLISISLALFGCNIKPKKEPIYIFYTSDVHCGLNDNVSFAALKGLIEETKKEHKDVL